MYSLNCRYIIMASNKMTKGLFSSNTDLWATPQAFFDKLNERFHFSLDPCANADNAKCEQYYTQEQDGLKQDWGANASYSKGV